MGTGVQFSLSANNHATGGINPVAVAAAPAAGGQVVWMPTADAGWRVLAVPSAEPRAKAAAALSHLLLGNVQPAALTALLAGGATPGLARRPHHRAHPPAKVR